MSAQEKPWWPEATKEPEPRYPNDLDGCAGLMFGLLLSYVVIAFVVIVCLAAMAGR